VSDQRRQHGTDGPRTTVRRVVTYEPPAENCIAKRYC